MNSYIQVKKFIGPEKTEELLRGWIPISCKGQVQQIKAWFKNQSMLSEDQKKKFPQGKDNIPVEAAQASTRNNWPQQVPKKDKPTPKRNQKGKQKARGKEKSKWNKTYPQNYRIPKKEKTAMANVFNIARTLMEFKNKEEQRLNQLFPKKEILQVKESQKTIIGLENVNEDSIYSLTQIWARIDSKLTLLNQPDDNSISFITRQLKELIIQVQNLESSTGHNAALFQEKLEKSDKSRLELKEDIKSSINNISLKNDLPRQFTPILDRNVLNLNNDVHHTISSNAEVETACNFKDIARLEEWPTFSGEGEYNHMELMKTIDMLKEAFDIPDEYISARLHFMFTKSEKKWYYKLRQDHGKHSCPWWKEQMISKWANDYWRFKMENSFEEAIFNIERERTMSWFLKKKDRLTALHPDISETMIHKRILIECGGDVEHAIRSRCNKPLSTEDYINSMADITTRTKIGRNSYKPPMDNKPSGKTITKPNKPHDKDPLKCHICGSKYHLANPCPKKTRINDIELDKVEDTKETNNLSLHESDSEPSEEEEGPIELSIENLNISFVVTEVHTHLTQYSDEFMDLIHVEAKLHLDSGSFCTCVGKDYLDRIYTNWKEILMPIEGIKLSSASQDMHPLGIFEAAMIFPHPAGSIRLKVEFFVINNCTSHQGKSRVNCWQLTSRQGNINQDESQTHVEHM
ncbi:hypothetical protein O181_069916 [Austropuccinia psidii MF-1]|uniref:Uncharacterized protein n=1 Tax=Austropuccinia psidii MF-1 TaxID=1389203 RepID=A0A9Q3I577_9BASI|nr:hypothetical protein [Austropuccinia psidii MF-1]